MNVLLLCSQDAEGPPPDPVLGDVAEALGACGHDVARLVIGRDVAPVVDALRRRAPDLVFNLAESFRGKSALESSIASMLNLLGLRYTGSSHTGLTLAGDKSLTKKILSFHGIRVPESATVHRGALDWADALEFPLIVKPPQEDASLGITSASVVRSLQELLERIDEVQRDHAGPVLVERYVEGREFYVPVLGNERAEALPVAELDMSRYPDGVPRIASHAAKWEEGHAEYDGSVVAYPKDLEEATLERMRGAALETFHALRLRDYARIDLRVTPDGEVFVIEANPNCYLARSEVFAQCALRGGLEYDGLIGRIVDLAMARYDR